MTNIEFLEKVKAVVLQMAKDPHQNVVYISGKVTGLHPGYVKTKFSVSERILKAKGYSTFNPTAHIKPDCDWAQAMKLCIAILPLCSSIYMQEDWKDSAGAIEEYNLAQKLELSTIYE